MQLPRCAKFLFIIDGNRVLSLQKEAGFLSAADCISLLQKEAPFAPVLSPCSKEAAPRHVPTRAAAKHALRSMCYYVCENSKLVAAICYASGALILFCFRAANPARAPKIHFAAAPAAAMIIHLAVSLQCMQQV